MKTKLLLAICLLLSAGLLSAYDLYGAFQIKTSPKGADVNLVDIDLYLCSTPSPVFPVFMDEYMELREGIPGRTIRVVISKEGYEPLEKNLFVPFLYEDQREALDYPTVFNFRLTRDRGNRYVSITNYYAYNCYRPRPAHYFYYPGYFWYPPPPGGYMPHPPGYVPPRPPHGGNHPGHPGGGGQNPPGDGEFPGGHGRDRGSTAPGGNSGSHGRDRGSTAPGGNSGSHGGSGYTPPSDSVNRSYGGSFHDGGYKREYTPPSGVREIPSVSPPSGNSGGTIERSKPQSAPNEHVKPAAKEKDTSETPLEILRKSIGRDRK
ncbi:MAG: hypothetical protein KBA54_01000 [Candidatus Cloacimonetes bacterium]|nr:hypothetical protein [Candidatus Cloacimonadota bacterium]